MVRRLVAVLMLAGLVAGVPAGAGAAPPDPHFNEPTVGDCHSYGIKAVGRRSETSAPVPCKTKHTAKVFQVFQLPDTTDWTAADAQLYDLVRTKCDPAFKTWMGRNSLTIALTAYSYAWYAPAQAEQDAGARWLRCDIIAYKSVGLAPLTRNKAPMIPQPLTNAVRRCLNGAKYYTTVCTAKHQWRATGDFAMAKGRYPSATKFQKVARSRCPKLVSSRRYLYDYPSKAEWKSGDRITVCFSKTNR